MAAYGTIPRTVQDEAEAPQLLRSRQLRKGGYVGVALCAVVVLVVSSQQHQIKSGPVELEEAPAASDFFASALAGLKDIKDTSSHHTAKKGNIVSLHQSKNGNVNLNVDIERNGKQIAHSNSIKVPVGSAAHLRLAMPQNQARLQSLENTFPADEDDEAEDDDTDEVDRASDDVKSAKERVVEDAKTLHDIATAIKEEKTKEHEASEAKEEAMDAQQAAQKHAIEEVEKEKAELREAKKAAETSAMKKSAEAMHERLRAEEAIAAKETAEAKAVAAAQKAKVALEKKREAEARYQEHAAIQREQDAIENEKSAKEEAVQVEQHEQETAEATGGMQKKKEGAVNMNIKVNVDSPVGGDWSGVSPEGAEEAEKEAKRQVNMNIVVNVRSPQETGGEQAEAEPKSEAVGKVMPEEEETDDEDEDEDDVDWKAPKSELSSSLPMPPQ
mmetsp:Transcript_34768/g.54318  ORF Transcript_34768/g.54318 Transcript_34768/m.54318 type:complete len:443 (+) Transcript_34768:33-1361(+)|eukprot:CAMPEP_0184294792 /NCGR_PEP_ID=MMETSP1049-20130417/5891_1 /TAXON_ID=77928 /ORGANISM="Proteomonas sulcata, Strain CCMP704" /LENGTH=442 /DNA_ID=CAMNT_0026603195 /DNA_START=15 /DNA_END=1343 /DNA_ORIENTATION=-